PGLRRMESGTPTLPMSWRSAATSRFCSSASSRPSSWPTRMPHSASRVLCTPVLRSFKSRSWLKAQMTELRSAEACSSSCLMRRDSRAPEDGEPSKGAGIWPLSIVAPYKQSKKQDPEPPEPEPEPDVEPELFTQAETA